MYTIRLILFNQDSQYTRELKWPMNCLPPVGLVLYLREPKECQFGDEVQIDQLVWLDNRQEFLLDKRLGQTPIEAHVSIVGKEAWTQPPEEDIYDVIWRQADNALVENGWKRIYTDNATAF